MTSLRLAQLAVLVLDLGEQLGVADGDADLARVQVEERLVGALPRPRRRQAGQDEADPLVARAEVGADRHRARRGSAPRPRRESGSTNMTTAAMNPKLASASRAARSAMASTPSRGSADSTAARIEPELAVAPLGIGGQPVVALGELGEDVRRPRPGWAGSGRRPRRARPPRRSRAAAGTRSCPTAAPPTMPTTTATANMNRRIRRPDLRLDRAGRDQQDDPKRPSGTTAAARRVRVRRVWNDSATALAAGRRRRSSVRGRRGPRRRSRRRWARRRPVGDEPVADAADGEQVARAVRVELELLAQAAHRDPDVGRFGVVGLRPAADEQRLGRHGLAEVGGEGEEEPRLGRGERDRLAADDRLAPVELEDEVRARGRGPGAGPGRRPAAGPDGSARAAPSSGRAW